MKYSISEAREIILAFYKIFQNYKIKIPVLLNGGTGMGKTSMLVQLAKELGLELVDIKLGLLPEVIGAGVPKLQGDKFTLVPVEELKRACEEPALLFLDELSLATDFKVAVSLLFGGKVLGYSLHPGTFIVSACNTGADYDVSVIPKQVLARFAIVNLAYSEDNILFLMEEFPEFKELLQINGSQIVKIWEEEDSNEELTPVACPRTLAFALWVLKAHKAGLIEDNLKIKMLSTLLPQSIIKLLIETPLELISFVKIKSGIFEVQGDIGGILNIIKKEFPKLDFEEKINVLTFIVKSDLINLDTKSGTLKELVNDLSNQEKSKIFNLPLFKEIEKIVKGFMA